MGEKPEDLFRIWYSEPLFKIDIATKGDSAFITTATCIFLYERYAITQLKELKKKGINKDLCDLFSDDFNIIKPTAEIFWNVMRNGLLHGAMPKQKDDFGNEILPGWVFSRGSLNKTVELKKDENGDEKLFVDPLRFMQKVISIWNDKLDLLDRNQSFPWANVYLEETDDDTSSLVTGSSSGLDADPYLAED